MKENYLSCAVPEQSMCSGLVLLLRRNSYYKNPVFSIFPSARLLMPFSNAVSQAAPQTQPVAYHFLLAALDESQLSTQHTELRYGSCGLSI